MRDLYHSTFLGMQTWISNYYQQFIILVQNISDILRRANSRIISLLEALCDPVNIDSLFLLDIFANYVWEFYTIS
jgi:hypothetical protein